MFGVPTEAHMKDGTETFRMAEAPPIASLQEAGFASTPSFADDFDGNWNETQTAWEVAYWVQNRTQMDPARNRADGSGHLVQTLLPGLPGRGGSMQTAAEFGWGRWVARLKPSSVPGALHTMFTKDWDDKNTPGPKDDGLGGEIDIELLTYTFGPNRGEVHLAIHLRGRSNLWVRDVPLDFNPSDDFHEWGFDVLPDRVVWHVDGKFIAEWLYTDEHYIDPAYEFFFNSWTMERWIQGPPAETAHYHIDWVKFYPLIEESGD